MQASVVWYRSIPCPGCPTLPQKAFLPTLSISNQSSPYHITSHHITTLGVTTDRGGWLPNQFSNSIRSVKSENRRKSRDSSDDWAQSSKIRLFEFSHWLLAKSFKITSALRGPLHPYRDRCLPLLEDVGQTGTPVLAPCCIPAYWHTSILRTGRSHRLEGYGLLKVTTRNCLL